MALHRSLIFALLAAAALLSGCVYRPDIQQGNLLSVKDVEQVQVGMTRSQVRFLLGTPMISDPFAPHRWDYLYRMEYGRRNRSIDTVHFIVFFEGDKVTKVEMVDVLEPQGGESGEAQRGWNPFRRKTPEPPAPGLAAQPPPGG
jgi:outer membrane protein assembly factor BamE